MTVRNIKKSLVAMEDIAQGKGEVSQTRAGNATAVHKVDVPYALDTTVEMSALDVTKYTHARVYDNATFYVDYLYDVDSVDGIVSDTGPGSWFGVAQGGYRTEAGTPVGALTPKFIGEEVLDTANSVFYKAYGTLDTEWV